MTSKNEGLWAKASNDIGEYFTKVIKPHFPLARPLINQMVGTPEQPPNSFQAELSLDGLFKGSDYDIPKRNDYVHFTSVQSLAEILRSGYFRASEFRHLHDTNELKFGFHQLRLNDVGLDERTLNRFKEQLFSLSMSRFSDKALKNQFMWSEYGNKSQGVAIRFKLLPPTLAQHSIGKIQYGSASFKRLRQIRDETYRIRHEGGMVPNPLIDLVFPIIAYHKESRFSLEDEVRILFKNLKEEHKKHDHIAIEQWVNQKNNLRYFYKIFLKEKYQLINENGNLDFNYKTFRRYFLGIQITDLYFGCQITPEDLTDFEEYFGAQRRSGAKFTYKMHRITGDNLLIQLP